MSVRQIAQRAGVSTATVSRVINNDPNVSPRVRDRVITAANQARYVPRIGRRSTTNIAFVYTDTCCLSSPFDAALLQGMSERMEQLGFDLLILGGITAKLPQETFSQSFMRKGVRGAILRTTARTRHVCEQIAEEGFPAVVVGERFDHPNVSFIYSDSRASSREAVEHLIALGHRRIAVSVNVVDDSDHADRVAGYRDALSAHHIEIDERLVVRTPAHRLGGEQVIRRLMTTPDRPTAVYLADPMAAVGALNETQRLDLRVPGDVSIVGFDDAELRFLVHPQMTAVCQDAPQVGREALEALRGMMIAKGKSSPVRRVLDTTFEVHESTGRLAP